MYNFYIAVTLFASYVVAFFNLTEMCNETHQENSTLYYCDERIYNASPQP